MKLGKQSLVSVNMYAEHEMIPEIVLNVPN